MRSPGATKATPGKSTALQGEMEAVVVVGTVESSGQPGNFGERAVECLFNREECYQIRTTGRTACNSETRQGI
jgi:hypothetical protein